jgi:hypothetical protein
MPRTRDEPRERTSECEFRVVLRHKCHAPRQSEGGLGTVMRHVGEGRDKGRVGRTGALTATASIAPTNCSAVDGKAEVTCNAMRPAGLGQLWGRYDFDLDRKVF